MNCHCTVENLPSGGARLIVYSDPNNASIKVIHDFTSMDELDRYLATATKGISTDAVI